MPNRSSNSIIPVIFFFCLRERSGAPTYLCALFRHFYPHPMPHGALELVWNILDFQEEQDVRLKLGYELVDKIPYVQLRENNWTINADANGKWNVRYNL